MTYIQRINYRPNQDKLSTQEQQYLQQHFDAYGSEMLVDGVPVRWQDITEVEVAEAPRAAGPAGWLVRRFFLNSQQLYHVGIYLGTGELVLPNIGVNAARYVLENIAYYAPQRITYTGPEGLVPLTEI
jgi:hypothetical protein